MKIRRLNHLQICVPIGAETQARRFYADVLGLTEIEKPDARVVAVVGALADEDFAAEIQMPWGAMTMAQIAEYPYWNAKYHEGQINFIASMLGDTQ